MKEKFIEMAYIGNEESCVVLSKKDYEIDEVIEAVKFYLIGYGCNSIVIEDENNIKESYIRRRTEENEDDFPEDWDWKLDKNWISDEPVWVVDVCLKAKE